MNKDGINLPPWTRLIPKDIPGWYWVMRQGMWPKCIRTIHGRRGLRPANLCDGQRMEEYTHFIGPCAEPEDLNTKNIFVGEKIFKREPKKKGSKYKDVVYPERNQ